MSHWCAPTVIGYCIAEPFQERLRIAYRGGQANTLQHSAGLNEEPLKNGKQVPAAIIAGKRMNRSEDQPRLLTM